MVNKFNLQPRSDDGFNIASRDGRVSVNKKDHENMRNFRFFFPFNPRMPIGEETKLWKNNKTKTVENIILKLLFLPL